MEPRNSASYPVSPISRLAAWLVLIIAVLVLAGWAFDITLLKSIRPQWNSMKVITALCLIATAGSLAWLQSRHPWKRGLAKLLAMLVCAVAASNLILYATVVLTGHDPAWAGGRLLGHVFGPTNRMAVISALIFLGLSSAALLLGTGGRRRAGLAHVIILPVALLSYLVLVGYLLNVPALDDWLGVTVAIHTAVALLALCVGLLYVHTDTWFMSILASHEAGGTTARRLLPAVLIFPLTFAWLKLEAEKQGWFPSAVGVALVAIANTTVLFWLVWLSSKVAIEKQRQSNAAVRESEERFRLLFHQAAVGIKRLDADEHMIEANDKLCDILGYSPEELLQRSLGDITHPEDLPLERAELARLLSREIHSYSLEKRSLRKDGSIIWVRVTSSLPAIDSKANWWICVVEDITARKQAEEALQQAKEAVEKTADDLARSNKDLEQFAYVASHDLQEPLRAVAGFMGMLKRQYKDQLDATAQEYIGHGIDGAERMQALIADLLTFSRVGTRGGDFARISMQAALDRALSNLKIAIEESGALITSDALPEIECDASQMVQLLQNLIANGIKFHGERQPKIHLSARHEEGQWTFCVADNGIGIEEQYYNRIFLIFQRLHSRTHYSGTGIGLAVCKKIAERHGGSIWVESKLGEGSTFCFTIPDRGDHE